MRPTLRNLPQIEKLSQPLAEAMRGLHAAISTGWNKQHQGDGSHTDISATSATVSGLTTLGRTKLNQVTYEETGVAGAIINDLYVTGLEQVSCLRLVPAAAGFPFSIGGITADGREAGELLLLVNASNVSGGASVVLRSEHSGSKAVNRFASVTGSPTAYNIGACRGVLVQYNYLWTSTADRVPVPRWIVIGETEIT